MNKELLQKRINELLETEEGISNDKYNKKLQSMLALLDGKEVYYIMQKFEAKESSIYRWKKILKDNDIEAIERIQGSPGKLKTGQRNAIDNIILKSPMKYGYFDDTWSGLMIKEVVKNKFDISISERSCQKLIKAKNGKDKNIFEDDDYKSIEIELEENIWSILVFKIWEDKERITEEGKIRLKFNKEKIYYVALNIDDNRLMIRLKNSKSKKNFKEFIEELYQVLDKNVPNILQIGKNSTNKKLCSIISKEDIQTYNLQIEYYTLKGYKRRICENYPIETEEDIIESTNYYADVNQLYNLKFYLLKTVEKRKISNPYYFPEKGLNNEIKDVCDKKGYTQI